MTVKYFFTSLTRISNLPEVSLSVEPLPREMWDTGDYVVGEVDSFPGSLTQIELASGRMVEVVEGDLILGAFGKRYATLEAAGVGDYLWQHLVSGGVGYNARLYFFGCRG